MSLRFPARLGLAITNPQAALRVAADRTNAGRSGTDLFLVILMMLAATQLRGLFGAAWLAVAVHAGLGFRAVIQVLTHSLTIELAFIVIAALGLWLAGWKKRDLGRAFDLACVAVLPLIMVDVAATVIVRAFELTVPAPLSIALATGSHVWAAVVVLLALRPARQPVASIPAPPVSVIPPARAAGWTFLGVLLVGVVVQTVWIARHTESIRPMTEGNPAPELALPAITASGTRGPAVSLAGLRGKVVVLDFWATWCGPCLKAMPRLETLSRMHPDVTVLAINLDDPSAARALWDANHYHMELLADDGHVSERYGVTTIPHSVVIDREGVVRLVARGTSTQIDATVRVLLGEQIRK